MMRPAAAASRIGMRRSAAIPDSRRWLFPPGLAAAARYRGREGGVQPLPDLPYDRSRRTQRRRPQSARAFRAQGGQRRQFRLFRGDEKLRHRLGRRHWRSICTTRKQFVPGTKMAFPGIEATRKSPTCSPICEKRRNEPDAVLGPDGAADRRQGPGRRVAASRSPRRRPGCANATASCPGLPRSWSATIRRARSMYAARRAPALAAGIASFEHRLPADCGMPRAAGADRRLNADDRVDGILVQLPLPRGSTRPGDRRARSGEGRRRLSSAQCRAAVERRAGPRPLHAAGRDAAVAQRPTRPVGRRIRRARPLANRRPSDGGVAARCRLHGHDRPFEDAAMPPRSAAAPTSLSPRWEARDGHGRLDQTRRDRDRCRDQSDRRPPDGGDAAGRRCRFRGGEGDRRRDHAGAGRRRADDDRLPVAKYATGRVPAAGPPRSRPLCGASRSGSYDNAGTAVC